MQQGLRRAAAIAAVISSGAVFGAATAQAATFPVACGNVTALRNAVTAANATPAPDVIDVTGAPCDFVFTTSAQGASPDQTALPFVSQPLTIEGHGARLVRTGAANMRFLRSTTALTVRDLSFVGGRLVGTAAQGVFGGAIYNVAGTLTLEGASFQGNAVSGSSNSRGGAVFTLGGTVTATGGSFTQNSASTFGGAIATFSNVLVNPATPAVVSVTGTSFSQNTSANGGAIATDAGSLALHDATLSANTTPTTSFNVGGAVFSNASAITVDQGSALTGNTAALGGAVYALAGSVLVQDSDVSGNTGTAAAGGIATGSAALTIRRSTISGNVITVSSAAGNGGGLFVNDGSALVEDSTIADNVATFGGGAFYTQNADATLRRTTIEGNRAEFTNGAGLVAGGHVLVETSTVSGNVATTFANGGLAVIPSAPQNNGAVPGEPGVLDVVSTTVTDNGLTGNPAPGNQLAANGRNGNNPPLGATLTVRGSIVSDDDPGPISAPCAVSNGGTIVDDGGNLEFPGTTCGFDTSANPLLGPLADNGGETLTHLPQPGSPVIDLAGAGCPSPDQRGKDRPDGDACDAGSVETPAPETSAAGPASSPTADPEITFSSDDDAATFECRIDEGAWAPCTSPISPDLTDGEHTVEVRAVDADGYTDPSPASRTFVVDTTGPVVDITGVQVVPGQPPTAQVSFTVDETATDVECKLDGGDFADCTSPYATGPLTPGEHTVTVRATDALGNPGTDSATFSTDTTPPETTITAGTSGTVYNDGAGFSFTSSEPGSTFECKLDGGAFTPCTSPRGYSNVTPGTHTFSVRAIDASGNVDPTPATRTWTYKKCTIRVGLAPNLTICL